jgi:hypothetical protein
MHHSGKDAPVDIPETRYAIVRMKTNMITPAIA